MQIENNKKVDPSVLIDELQTNFKDFFQKKRKTTLGFQYTTVDKVVQLFADELGNGKELFTILFSIDEIQISTNDSLSVKYNYELIKEDLVDFFNKLVV